MVDIVPGGTVSEIISSLGCRRMVEYPLFPLLSTTGAMVGARLDSSLEGST